MKKAFLISLAMLCCSAAVVAQDNNVKFSAGAELGFASGSFSNTHSIGIGGSAMLEIPLQDKLNWTAYAGFVTYASKFKSFRGQTVVPLRVGVKYFLTDAIYGGLQAGLGLLSGNLSGTAFSYSPQIGYEFKTKSGKAVDATIKYDAYSKNGTLGGIGFRLAYIF